MHLITYNLNFGCEFSPLTLICDVCPYERDTETSLSMVHFKDDKRFFELLDFLGEKNL